MFSAIGLIGVVIILLGYGLLSAGKIQPAMLRYHWLNIIGTSCILVSLIEQWNLPAFIANAAWLAIALVGLLRVRTKRA